MLEPGSHLEVMQSRLWEPLTRRYRLRGSRVAGHRPVVFADQLVAIIDADRLLDVYDLIVVTVSIVADTVNAVGPTTPAGKMRWVQWLSTQQVAGTYSSQVFLQHPADQPGQTGIPLDVIRTTGTVENVVSLGQPVPMPPGWSLNARITSFVGAGNYTVRVVVREQDIVDNRTLARLL